MKKLITILFISQYALRLQAQDLNSSDGSIQHTANYHLPFITQVQDHNFEDDGTLKKGATLPVSIIDPNEISGNLFDDGSAGLYANISNKANNKVNQDAHPDIRENRQEKTLNGLSVASGRSTKNEKNLNGEAAITNRNINRQKNLNGISENHTTRKQEERGITVNKPIENMNKATIPDADKNLRDAELNKKYPQK